MAFVREELQAVGLGGVQLVHAVAVGGEGDGVQGVEVQLVD
jgi:hypothetical protein